MLNLLYSMKACSYLSLKQLMVHLGKVSKGFRVWDLNPKDSFFGLEPLSRTCRFFNVAGSCKQ